jgi:hypothetical protein
MNAESISILKTVCTAGSASEGFNGDSNERLQHLADVGLLVVAYAPLMLNSRREYKPTPKGWELFKQLVTASLGKER